MATVPQGQSQVVSLGPNDAIKVSTPGEAYVDHLSGTPESPYASTRLIKNTEPKVFGPYGANAQLRVRAIESSALYDGYTDPQPALVNTDPTTGQAVIVGPRGPLPLVEMNQTEFGFSLASPEIVKDTIETLVLSSGFPILFPPSMTISPGGSFTLDTAIAYRIKKGFMHIKANQLYSGSPAGLYYMEMSSTTSGLMYQNMHTNGMEVAPNEKIPFTQISESIAYIPDINVTVYTATRSIPAGFLGEFGSVKGKILFTTNDSTNLKNFSLLFGNETAFSHNLGTGNTTSHWDFFIKNQGGMDQVVGPFATGGVAPISSATNPNRLMAQDTNLNINLRVGMKLAAVTDFIILSSYSLEASKL